MHKRLFKSFSEELVRQPSPHSAVEEIDGGYPFDYCSGIDSTIYESESAFFSVILKDLETPYGKDFEYVLWGFCCD